MSENDKRRISQLEEQLSNTLRAVDALHADVEVFKDYAIENNKVVNGMLRRMGERDDSVNQQLFAQNQLMQQLLEEMIAGRKKHDDEMGSINKRLDQLEGGH